MRSHLVPDWPQALVAAPATTGAPPADTWGYFVPALSAEKKVRTRYRTPQTALYAPTQHRYHSVAIELCLDGAEMAAAGDVRDVSVTFVVRRTLFTADLTDESREKARTIAAGWEPAHDATKLSDADLLDVLGARDFLTVDPQVPVVQSCQARDAAGWQAVDCAAPIALIAGEREYPMWRRVPADPADRHCLWFGSVPIDVPYQDALDPLNVDNRWTYRLLCVARRGTPPDKPFCPPSQWLSTTSIPFRIAPLLMTR